MYEPTYRWWDEKPGPLFRIHSTMELVFLKKAVADDITWENSCTVFLKDRQAVSETEQK